MKIQHKSISISTGKQYFLSTFILFIFIMFLYYIQDVVGYQTVSLILLLVLFLLPLFSFERGPIILSAVISALAWDYYFIPPHFTMHIAKPEDVMMLFMFFIIAMTNGVLTARLKEQQNEMAGKERKSNALYNLLKDLSGSKNLDEVSEIMVMQIQNTFGLQAVIFYSDHNKLGRSPHPASSFIPDEMEWLTAEMSFREKTETGRTTTMLQDADALYFPLKRNDFIFGVTGIRLIADQETDEEEKEFLRICISEIIPFIERNTNYSMP